MTLNEFSSEFDFWVSQQIKTTPGIGAIAQLAFDEYEKSVYLTNAQEQLVTTYYTGRNDAGITFEITEEARRYLDELVKTVELDPVASGTLTARNGTKSKLFNKPQDLWFITYEQCQLTGNCQNLITPVIPCSQDDFYNSSNNPFKTKNRVLRLDSGNGQLELVSDKQIKSYKVRYIRKLKPIVLTNIGKLQIDGYSTPQKCELNDVLHRDILKLAVALAMQAVQTNKSEDRRKQS